MAHGHYPALGPQMVQAAELRRSERCSLRLSNASHPSVLCCYFVHFYGCVVRHQLLPRLWSCLAPQRSTNACAWSWQAGQSWAAWREQMGGSVALKGGRCSPFALTVPPRECH